jgi:hypothetical protein
MLTQKPFAVVTEIPVKYIIDAEKENFLLLRSLSITYFVYVYVQVCIQSGTQSFDLDVAKCSIVISISDIRGHNLISFSFQYGNHFILLQPCGI